MSLLDRSHFYNFERINGRLFDFQLAAVNHCVDLLRHGQPAVLGLDTGLGKTCTVREIIKRIGGPVRWVCPGGLVRQTVAGLKVPPWGLADGEEPLVVVKAETGKELARLNEGNVSYDVAVVNRALCGVLRTPPQGNEDFSMTVVDEAHQMQPHQLRYKYGLPNARVLLVSACARESTFMMEALRYHGSRRTQDWAQKYAKACFIVEKTDRVLKCIGAAQPRLVTTPVRLSAPRLRNYLEMLKVNLSFHPSTKSIIHATLAAGRILNDEVSFANIAARLADRRPANDPIRNEVRDICLRLGCEHVPAAAVPIEEEPVAKRAKREEDDNNNSSSREVCACCGLSSTEYRILHKVHVDSLPHEDPIWSGGQMTGFGSALVRFPSSRALNHATTAHPPPSSVDIFVLTSAHSASYRANLVKKFASHNGNRYKLAVISRAAKNGTCPPLLLKVLTIGHGYFHRELISYIAKPRLLLTDQTIDVGFDLHRHLDGITASHVLCSPTQMQQLVGRLARVCVDRIGIRDSIDVVTPIQEGTLDSYFVKHLNADIGESDEVLFQREQDAKRVEVQQAASRIRTLLSSDPELLSLFERLYSGDMV